MQCRQHCPGRREQTEAQLQPDDIHDVAGHRLQQQASLEKAGDPAIFELGDAEFRLEHGKGHHHAENVAGEVVEDGADGDESDHPPAQCPQASDPRQW